MVIFLVILGIVVFIGVIILIWAISTNNWFKQTKVKIDESKSSIDIALTKRYDLLTKSLATVKGYAKHEQETLIKTIEMRNQKISDLTMAEKNKLNSQMDQVFKSINVVAEQYPELKADKAFNKLQDQMQDCEDNLQATRRIFNSNISVYNQKIVSFPSSIIANMHKYGKEDFFEAEETKKQDVKIEF